MAFEKTPNRGAGFGAVRFVVRGPHSYRPDHHLVLRPLYNEYPERFALDPNYPQPGRRGPSRPPLSSGEPPSTTEPRSSLYPTPRLRGPVEIVSYSPGPAGEDLGAGGNCFPRGETHAQLQSVNATTTLNVTGATIRGPFVVTRFYVQMDKTTGVNVGVKLIVGIGPVPGSDTTDDDGYPIVRNAFNLPAEVEPEREGIEGFPNLHVPTGDYHLKFILRNGDASATQFQCLVDIVYL
jgi:hypothetical protein